MCEFVVKNSVVTFILRHFNYESELNCFFFFLSRKTLIHFFFSSCNIITIYAVGYGKCTRDSMWSSLWCRSSLLTWHLYATFVDHIIHIMHHHHPNIHFRHPNPQTHWSKQRNSKSCWRFLHSNNPTVILTQF